MSLHVDKLIAEAIAQGKMDDLPYKGEPIPIEDAAPGEKLPGTTAARSSPASS